MPMRMMHVRHMRMLVAQVHVTMPMREGPWVEVAKVQQTRGPNTIRTENGRSAQPLSLHRDQARRSPILAPCAYRGDAFL